MANTLVECIPNFSEGRDQKIIDQLLAVLSPYPTIRMLDHHADADHNRTVITFVGEPAEVEDAAIKLIQKAAQLIDMTKHSGEHPRIGAADVVPFVPIRGITLKECVAMSERVAERVGRELDIPVYLYEESARIPERRNLEKIRKGQYEGLKEEIGSALARKPDFGPSELGTAGAVVIGARAPLIAFNVYLNNADVSAAKKIARAVRHSSGGLRFVKAMGVLVDGRAQVSMNLTDFNRTAIPQVVELIRAEAARYGAAVHHCELVGLIPQKALIDAAKWYLQLDQFEDEQILEYRLANAGPQDEGNFLDRLASSDPTPGGGSAAAYSAAQATALVTMVARLTAGRKKYAQHQVEMEAVIEQADGLRADLSALVQEDADAYTAVMAAYKLPKDDQSQKDVRAKAIQDAMLTAAETPLSTCRKALAVLELALSVVKHGNINAITDGGTGAALAHAALSSAAANVRINLASISDQKSVTAMEKELAQITATAEESHREIRETINTRSDLPLF